MKYALPALFVAAMASTSAHADTLLGANLGLDIWAADVSGAFTGNNINEANYDYDGATQYRLWAQVEHPVPLIPNVGLRYNKIEDDAFNLDAKTTTKVDLSHLDLILYYEILDNDLISVDVGGAWKQMQGEYATDNIRPELDSGVFMGYGNAMVGVPGLGLYAFADVLTGVNETGVYDYSIGLGWNMSTLLVDLKLRMGYRDFQFDADDFSGINADQRVDGFFAGVEFDF